MKIATLAAVALVGASFAAAPASATAIGSGISKFEPSTQVMEIGHRHGKKRFFKRRRHRDRDFGFHFGFGVPLFLGLGHALSHRHHDDVDCIGRWHRHKSRWHCHGQIVWD